LKPGLCPGNGGGLGFGLGRVDGGLGFRVQKFGLRGLERDGVWCMIAAVGFEITIWCSLLTICACGVSKKRARRSRKGLQVRERFHQLARCRWDH
jgi:hypothetical protein